MTLIRHEFSLEESIERLNQAASIIRELDQRHPIMTVYGELPEVETIQAMPLIDIWGSNSYRGISFGELFEQWRSLSSLPFIVSEFGADAYNTTTNKLDEISQAIATRNLITEILTNSKGERRVALGGILFSMVDEHWKSGNPNIHDIGSIVSGGGPYPDGVFNEEWWGILDIDRKPREAYFVVKELYTAE